MLRTSSPYFGYLMLVLSTLSWLSCTTAPLPARSVPTFYQRYEGPEKSRGSVLLDVVDGPSLVRAEPLPSPTLCATPCELHLKPGSHELTLSFLDEHGELKVDRVRVEVGETPSVHRRALGRQHTTRLGARVTGLVLFYTSQLVLAYGIGWMLGAGDASERKQAGVVMGSAGLGLGLGFGFNALGTKRVRGRDLRFARPQAPAL